MAGPLSGIKVLEMANVISGPYCAMLLADMGCDVVKVEMPGRGDIFRLWEPGELSPQFAGYNRGKKSATIDVRKPSGRDVYLKLARDADVILENFRPGTLDKLGVGYEAVSALNPDVIYCAVSGMGSSGPYRDRPTFDAIAQAMSGLWSQFTDLDDPEAIGPPLADQLTGMYAAFGIAVALASRAMTGKGQKIELSMLAGALAFQSIAISGYTMTGALPSRLSRAMRSQSYGLVCSDGLPLAIHLSTPHKFWAGLCNTIGRPELIEDPRFKDKAGRVQNYHILRQELKASFKKRPRAEWLELLAAADVPVAPLNTIAEAIEDPQVKHLDMVQTFGAGDRALSLVGFPIKLDKTPCAPGLPVPDVGEHTREILKEAGYSDQEIDRLFQEEAI